MPMEDVGRLLDTLDEGFGEATGEQPAVPAHDPGTEVIPGTGQYHRPPQHVQQQAAPQSFDERPTSALSPNDVLVARSAPPPAQDKLVASYGESPAPRDTTPAYGEQRTPFTGPQYVDSQYVDNQYTDNAGPHYVETTAPQQKYTGDPFSGPQYTADPLSGPHYTQPPGQAEPFAGPQYVDNEPVYQMPGDQRRQSPLSTDPLGFPSQAADPYQPAAQRQDQYPADPFPSDQYSSDQYGGRRADSFPADTYQADTYQADTYQADTYQSDAYQAPPQAQGQAPSQAHPSTAGLGTPMHGIPGAGRPRTMPQRRQPQPAHDDYGSYQGQQANAVDPLLALGRQEAYQQQPDPEMTRPYVTDPMFSTGERLRPEQPDYHERSDRREW
ncbi:hypothetical protein [Nonomuraea antimicrobica]